METKEKYQNLISELPEEEIENISKIIKVIGEFRFGLPLKNKVFIPFSHFPKEISKFDIIALVDKLEDSFEILNSLGIAKGMNEEELEIGIYRNDKYSLFRDLIHIEANKVVSEISLRSKKVVYDKGKSVLMVGNRKCDIPPATCEARLYTYFFDKNIGELVDWSEAYEEMESRIDYDGSEKDKKRLKDVISRANRRVMENIKTQDRLFSWSNNQIKRNF